MTESDDKARKKVPKFTRTAGQDHSRSLKMTLLCSLRLLVKVLRPTRYKIGNFRDVPKPISWLGIEKQNLTE